MMTQTCIRTMGRGIVLAGFLLVSACGTIEGTVQDGDPRNEIRALAAFALDDLRGARALAEASDDRIAAMCWSGLIDAAERLQAVVEQRVIGPATKWQIARNLRRNDHEACDALVSDARSTLFRIAGRIGVAIPGL